MGITPRDRGLARAAAPALFALSLLLPASVAAQAFRGAAEAAPQALYVEWLHAYAGPKGLCEAADYQEILRRFEVDAIDFAAVDLPLTTSQLQAKGLVQFPAAIGGVVPVLNIPGVVPGALRLTGPVLAEIFLGKISSWNDPKIVALNAALPLPDLSIRPAHPAKASGTTFVFTQYLSEQSSEWKGKVGAGLKVPWPAGEEREDSRAVVAYVLQTPGGIGFVDYGYAAERGVGKPKLQNRDGQFVAPTVVSFQAAAASAPWAQTPAFALLLVNQAGVGSWPLTAPTFAVLPMQPRHPERTLAALDFFRWALKSAADLTNGGGYVALPAPVAGLVEAAWKRQIKRPDGRSVVE
jgi:phosphate transport system substrate-binding protein